MLKECIAHDDLPTTKTLTKSNARLGSGYEDLSPTTARIVGLDAGRLAYTEKMCPLPWGFWVHPTFDVALEQFRFTPSCWIAGRGIQPSQTDKTVKGFEQRPYTFYHRATKTLSFTLEALQCPLLLCASFRAIVTEELE